jgi:hypothetical protein
MLIKKPGLRWKKLRVGRIVGRLFKRKIVEIQEKLQANLNRRNGTLTLFVNTVAIAKTHTVYLPKDI